MGWGATPWLKLSNSYFCWNHNPFPDKPERELSHSRGLKHTPTSIPPGQVSSSPLPCELLASAPDTSQTQGLPSLKINSAKTAGACACVWRGDWARPAPGLAHSGFWPRTSGSREGGHCRKQLRKQGPNELLGITLPAGQPFRLHTFVFETLKWQHEKEN